MKSVYLSLQDSNLLVQRNMLEILLYFFPFAEVLVCKHTRGSLIPLTARAKNTLATADYCTFVFVLHFVTGAVKNPAFRYFTLSKRLCAVDHFASCWKNLAAESNADCLFGAGSSGTQYCHEWWWVDLCGFCGLVSPASQRHVPQQTLLCLDTRYQLLNVLYLWCLFEELTCMLLISCHQGPTSKEEWWHLTPPSPKL